MNLASDLAELRLPEEAPALGEDTLLRPRAVLWESHPQTLTCAASLALDRIATGAKEAGEALRDEALEGYRRTLGHDHPDTVVAESGRGLDVDFDAPPL